MLCEAHWRCAIGYIEKGTRVEKPPHFNNWNNLPMRALKMDHIQDHGCWDKAMVITQKEVAGRFVYVREKNCWKCFSEQVPK